jgi:competence protein ComEC
MLEKPKLFLTLKQFWFSMLFLLTLLVIRLFFLYSEYEEFKEKPFYFTDVTVIKAYTKVKNSRPYTVLKLYSADLNLNFFTITFLNSKKIHQKLRMKLFPSSKMQFREYLGTSFIDSKVNEVFLKEKNTKIKFLNFIASQHENKMIANFYNAIFFANPLEKNLRNQVSKLGISHLIALSGFHLAILSSLLFFLLRPLYRFFQQRYFPYRFDLLDVGFMVLVILAWYVWFVDAPASLIRSYMMILTTWILLLLGVELLTLSFLSTITVLLLVIFPHFLLSLAFWFSIMGVFYIFLLLHYFSHVHKFFMTLIISFGIFLLMLPVVHMVFSMTTPLQLISPVLSLLFSFFYPLSMGLHLLGVGELLDGLLLQLFTIQSSESQVLFSPFLGAGYLLISLGAFYSKILFSFLAFFSLAFPLKLFMGFWV